jgi:YebC/PmpR family DNA-binding regulatory protein
MSGHSKWATIKRHKAAQDAKRGKAFSLLSKEISIAARAGGGDVQFNTRLRTAVNKARNANMPMDNIERAIQKGTGELPGLVIEEITYEGYGLGGVGLIIEVTSDNKNRTVAEVRSCFNKHGGNLASPGALAFNFQRQGQFLIDASSVTEDRLIELALEAGAEDIKNHGDHFEVLTPVSAFDAVHSALEQAKITCEAAEIVYLPLSKVEVSDAEQAKKTLRLIESLENLDDVKNVFTNAELVTEDES